MKTLFFTKLLVPVHTKKKFLSLSNSRSSYFIPCMQKNIPCFIRTTGCLPFALARVISWKLSIERLFHPKRYMSPLCACSSYYSYGENHSFYWIIRCLFLRTYWYYSSFRKNVSLLPHFEWVTSIFNYFSKCVTEAQDKFLQHNVRFLIVISLLNFVTNFFMLVWVLLELSRDNSHFIRYFWRYLQQFRGYTHICILTILFYNVLINDWFFINLCILVNLSLFSMHL